MVKDLENIDNVNYVEFVESNKFIIGFIDNSFELDDLINIRRQVRDVILNYGFKITSFEIICLDNDSVGVDLKVNYVDRKYLINEILRIVGNDFEGNDYYELAIKTDSELIKELKNILSTKNNG